MSFVAENKEGITWERGRLREEKTEVGKVLALKSRWLRDLLSTERRNSVVTARKLSDSKSKLNRIISKNTSSWGLGTGHTHMKCFVRTGLAS